MQPLRRQNDLNPPRMAYGDPPPRHAGLSQRTAAAVLRPTTATVHKITPTRLLDFRTPTGFLSHCRRPPGKEEM